MAKQKAAKKQAGNKAANQSVEPMVVALAEQLGSFLGRAQRKADGWMDNEALRAQLSQIRDGAAELLKQVNKSAAAVRKSVASRVPTKKARALAPPKRRGREGEKTAKTAAKSSKGRLAVPERQRREGRSGGVVDAPGKRHRKPPPQELFDPRLGEPMGKQMGQKSLKHGRSGRN